MSESRRETVYLSREQAIGKLVVEIAAASNTVLEDLLATIADTGQARTVSSWQDFSIVEPR